MRLCSGLLMIVLALAACTNAATARLAEYDGLERKIRIAYEDNAWENNGFCVRPRIGIITRSEIVEDGESALIVRIRHTIDGDTTGSETDNFIIRGCNGFGTRTFTFDKTSGGLVFREMSGPLKPTVKRNFNN